MIIYTCSIMASYDFTTLDKIQQIVKDCTKKPEVYLSPQDRISEDLRKSTKQLYDLAIKSKSVKSSKTNVLPQLIVNGFDSEQIWQQLELENNEEFGRLNLGKISKTLAGKKSWVLPLKLTKDNEPDENDPSENEEENMDEDIEEDMDEEMEEGSDDENLTIKKKATGGSVTKKRRTTEVDDKFFKLDELDEYLQKEDKKEVKGKSKQDDSSDEDNESIDLFKNLSDLDDNIEDEEEDEIKNGKALKYADFFDNPDSGDEAQEKQNKNRAEDDDEDDERFHEEYSDNEIRLTNILGKEKKQVTFNLLSNNSDETDSAENLKLENHEDVGESKGPKSTLEARQERLKNRIKELEAAAVAEKPWQLKGESSAVNRPQNSLLEEYVEFDSVSRPAPVMTEQTTMKLEDIIRRRIKDKAWDDVEKKFKPVETPVEYKKKLIMNQEKSKESLAQIYENEYVKQREALNEDDKEEQEKQEPPEHIAIREKMHSLFRKLDALTNFHYTPKPAKPEIKIVSNVPAISMEEVAPVATSQATLLAPEEVQSKRKGDLIGKSERSKTDMKRERRKKKLKQHLRAVHQSKKVVENVKQNKSLKKTAKTEKLKGRNIINVDTKNDGKSIKSSTAFFAQLQDQVESSIKAKTNSSVAKKKKDTLSAVRLKL